MSCTGGKRTTRVLRVDSAWGLTCPSHDGELLDERFRARMERGSLASHDSDLACESWDVNRPGPDIRLCFELYGGRGQYGDPKACLHEGNRGRHVIDLACGQRWNTQGGQHLIDTFS